MKHDAQAPAKKDCTAMSYKSRSGTDDRARLSERAHGPGWVSFPFERDSTTSAVEVAGGFFRVGNTNAVRPGARKLFPPGSPTASSSIRPISFREEEPADPARPPGADPGTGVSSPSGNARALPPPRENASAMERSLTGLSGTFPMKAIVVRGREGVGEVATRLAGRLEPAIDGAGPAPTSPRRVAHVAEAASAASRTEADPPPPGGGTRPAPSRAFRRPNGEKEESFFFGTSSERERDVGVGFWKMEPDGPELGCWDAWYCCALVGASDEVYVGRTMNFRRGEGEAGPNSEEAAPRDVTGEDAMDSRRCDEPAAELWLRARPRDSISVPARLGEPDAV